MDSLCELKKQLKLWEADFKHSHQRKPGKADIATAPSDIQEAYKKYSTLKKDQTGDIGRQTKPSTIAAAGNDPDSASDIIRQNKPAASAAAESDATTDDPPPQEKVEVWGSRFNRKVASPTDGGETTDSNAKTASSYLQNLGNKMFEQSLKLSKNKVKGSRNIMRRDVHAVTPAKTQKDRQTDRVTPIVDDFDEPFPDEIDIADQLSANSDILSKSQEEIEHNTPARFGKLFDKALSITKKKTKDVPYHNTDIFMNKFSNKPKHKQSVLPDNLASLVSKHKEKYGDIDWENVNTLDSGDSNATDDTHEEMAEKTSKHKYHKDWNDFYDGVTLSNDSNRIEIDGNKSLTKQNNKRNNSVKTCQSGVKNASNGPSDSAKESDISKPDIGIKQTKPATVVAETDSRETNDDAFAFSASEEENTPIKFKQGTRQRVSRCNTPVAGNKSKSKKVAKKHIETEAEVDENPESDNDGEDEENAGGQKKRKRKKKTGAGPAAKKQKTSAATSRTTMAGDDVNDGVKMAKKSVPRSKPVSNDNFVRLNMKAKHYQRKGKVVSGPAYKRMMWKQKMQARSKSYGDSCFKCGQSGHWANKCPSNKSGTSLQKEPVDDEEFPSMQEAVMLARGIRTEKMKPSSQQRTDVPDPEDISGSADAGTSYPAPAVVDREPDVELDIESSIVRTRPDSSSAPAPMEPLFATSEAGDIPETPQSVRNGLKKFGYDTFRPGQEEAVMRILCGLSTLVVLSTGGGKSLCYQLPAYLYSQRRTCLTLVVSPLVSLMEDQVTGLPNGIRGVCLHTNMTTSQREGVLSAVKDGKSQFLLVSPEAIAGGSTQLLSSLHSLPPIAFVCIDEAHCLSEWSHNFRPSYLRVCKVLQDKLGVQCFLGLTATATLSTASAVSRHLRISDFRRATIRGSPVPANLYLSVSRDDDRDGVIIELLQGDRFCNLGSIIIYCTRREQTDRVATIIRTCMNKGVPIETTSKRSRTKGLNLEWGAESYHAGLTPAQRKRVQNAFMSGRLRVVVATVAFGMGLDKSDVRGIIHYNMPKSFESYVQEIGRAGRDGEAAQCHVFLDPQGKDLCELRRHTYSNTVDYKTLKKLVLKVFPACRCRDVHERHAQAVKAAASDDITMETTANNNNISMETATTDCDKESPGRSPSQDGIVTSERLCPGHERALPIENTVMELDVKEEGISTLLCYLELHADRLLETQSNVYAYCKVQCYGGPAQLQAVAKKCPPVAVAIAKARKEGKSFSKSSEIEFSVVEICDMMGWDSGPVKKELKLLQWNFSDAGSGPRRTGVMVEFSQLAYHFRTPGDLTTDELDDILQFLHTRVQRQEKTERFQLSKLYTALKSVSHRNYYMCSDQLDMARNDRLKAVLNEYFDNQSLDSADPEPPQEEPSPDYSLDQVVGDIRHFHSLYGEEHTMSGRAVARIFHGIASPCFPATTWGRVRRFWRSHLNMDFNELMKIATKELISLR